jgi:hypothetical protein
MGAFQRLYNFLSLIFDYGNTDIEERFMFYRRLIPQLELGLTAWEGKTMLRLLSRIPYGLRGRTLLLAVAMVGKAFCPLAADHR